MGGALVTCEWTGCRNPLKEGPKRLKPGWVSVLLGGRECGRMSEHHARGLMVEHQPRVVLSLGFGELLG